jgi:2'-5' RNA ligase
MSGTPASQPLRAFIGIALDPALVPFIRETQQAWQARMPGVAVRWTKPGQLHLTLRFLGDVSPETMNTLATGLTVAADETQPFRIGIQGAGCFPSERNPTVLWLGITGDLAALHQLQTRVENAVNSHFAHVGERAFQPHLTIGRIQTAHGVGRSVSAALASLADMETADWHVDRIELVESRLTPEGSRYRTAFDAKLGGDKRRSARN